MKALLVKAWTGALACCPYPLTRWIGAVIGTAADLFRTRSARVTEINLAQCFPELTTTERRRLTRQSLVHTGRLLAETGLVFRASPVRLRRLIRSIRGQSLLDRALGEGGGVLVLVPHIGNWELFALRFGEYGFVALYDPPRDPGLDALVRANRERTGATLLPIDPRGFRSLVRALRSGRPVSLLPDQVPQRNAGLYAPFFSQPALTMTFAHRLIQRWQPRVLMGACLRARTGFEIRFSEPDPDIYAEDAHTSVAAMNRSIEALVREAPAQYQWEYKRFKRPPPGTPDLYSS